MAQAVFPRSMQVALLVRTRISLNELNRVQQSSAYSPLVIKLAQTSHTIKNSKRYLKEMTLTQRDDFEFSSLVPDS